MISHFIALTDCLCGVFFVCCYGAGDCARGFHLIGVVDLTNCSGIQRCLGCAGRMYVELAAHRFYIVGVTEGVSIVFKWCC